MFEGSLVESSAILRSSNRWPAVISTAFYAAIAFALVSLPMLRPEVLSVVVRPLATLAPPRAVPPPPPPPQHLRMMPSATSAASAPMPPTPTLITHNPLPAATPVEAPNFDPNLSMATSNTSTILSTSIPTGPSVRVAPSTNTTGTGGNGHTHLNVSTGVSQGLLLTPLRPLYPPIARAAHQEGTVTVQAIISRTGQIESAHVVNGPAMLQAAALDAVRSARYRPYLLNGQPTEVDTTFSINFRLGSSE